MDISRQEQRVLHALAQGGEIRHVRTGGSRVVEVQCLNREGWLMPELDLELFRKLKRRRAIGSRDGRPYRITRRGLELVRSQLDNR